jgi:signal transduction histidine kinase
MPKVLRFAREAALRRTIDEKEAALAASDAARRVAEDALSAKGMFVASTSHELRTPLNAILGFSEILKTEAFGPIANDRYREYAEIIHTSAGHLLSLINDLLDMAKIDAGKFEVHIETIDVFKVIIDCMRGIEPQAKRAHVGISVALHDGVDRIHGDDKRLHQMLLNLLSNAIKFTPEGGDVSVSAFRRGDSTGISVSDTGIGIKPEDLLKVLEPYRQVDSAHGRRSIGTGLGLPLTKELAELQGGSFAIESTEDVGTTVTVLFPQQSDAEPPKGDSASHATSSVDQRFNGKGKRARLPITLGVF